MTEVAVTMHPLDFDEIERLRDRLVGSLLRWRNPGDGLYRSSPEASPGATSRPPSFTNTGMVLQALHESGKTFHAQALAGSLLGYYVEHKEGPFPWEKGRAGDQPHVICNSWMAFSILDCLPAQAGRLQRLCEWLLSCQRSDGGWNLLPTDLSYYPMVTAYALSALLQFYRFLTLLGVDANKPLVSGLERAIEGGVGYLLKARSDDLRRSDLYLWPSEVWQGQKGSASFGTSAICMHVIAKAARVLQHEEWENRVLDTLAKVIDGYDSAGNGEFDVHSGSEGGPVTTKLWDSLHMNDTALNYTWYFFAPINLVTLLRFVRERRFWKTPAYYKFVSDQVQWITANVEKHGDGEGVRGAPTLGGVKIWSTAQAVIVLSRLLDVQAQVVELYRSVSHSSTGEDTARKPRTPAPTAGTHGGNLGQAADRRKSSGRKGSPAALPDIRQPFQQDQGSPLSSRPDSKVSERASRPSVMAEEVDAASRGNAIRAQGTDSMAGVEPERAVDLGIVIALKEEFRVFQQLLGGDAMTPQHDADLGDYIYTVQLQGYRCVVTLMGEMGGEAAVLRTDRLVDRWRPRLLVNLGIAGAIHDDLGVGDAIVASQIDSYMEAARAEAAGGGADGFRFVRGGAVFHADFKLVELLRQFEFAHARAFGRWRERCAANLKEGVEEPILRDLLASGAVRSTPELHDCHLASGPAVSAAAEFAKWIRGRDRNIKAIEMESGGVARAGSQRANPIPVLALRGISDSASHDKAAQDRIGKGALRRYAMHNILVLFSILLEEGVLLPRRSAL